MKPALIVIDMQKAYKDWGVFQYIDNALFMINSTLEFFRSKKLPVHFIYHTDEMVQENSAGFELMDGLFYKENESKIVKRFSNAFWKTNLEDKLKADGVSFVVLCGLAAGYCVNATYFGANERGFGAAILKGGITGYQLKYIEMTQELFPTLALDTLIHFGKGKTA